MVGVTGPDGPSVDDVEALRHALAAAERRAATLAELAALMNEGATPWSWPSGR